MANKQNMQWLPIVFVAALIVVVIAVIGAGLTGQAAWSTGENSKRTTYSSCSDTDKGMAYGVKGAVTAGGKTFTDACVNRDISKSESSWPAVASGNALREYYCERGVTKSYITYCPCSDGKCAEKYN